MIQITQREMIRLADRFFCYLYVVQFGTCIHCLSTHKKSCQMQRVGGGMVLTDSPWQESCKTIVMSEEYQIVSGMHAYTVQELLLRQSIAADVSDKCMI